MRFSTATRRRSLATSRAVVVVGLVWLNLSIRPVSAQQPPSPGAPLSDISNIPKGVTDTFDGVNLRNWPTNSDRQKKNDGKIDTCLLPPLTLVSSPTIAVVQLKITPKARKEYQQACTAMRNKNPADAEKHLRKAVKEYPKYSTAWVTLGQILAAQQRTEEARTACFEASVEDPSYIPAYLCLADIAARAHAWDQVVKLSGRALELDPANVPLAYEYHAAANLNLHNLTEAEKSGLRAADIDKDHRDPRVYFLLAQIYEATGNPAKEAAQLREYLKYAKNPDDIAAVEQYLAKIEAPSGQDKSTDRPAGTSSATVVSSSTRRWGPADIDEAVPTVRSDTPCPLPQVLEETSKRTGDFIANLQRFSANERIDLIDIGKNGKSRNATQMTNYVAQIQETSSGYPTVREYRSTSAGNQQPSLMDTGTAAFALIFHPIHVANFDFRCEGLTELRGASAWQLRFEESRDPSKAFHAIRISGSVYLPRFKGRAWIAADTYDVLRIETDLVSPILEIDLQREHMLIDYAPVEFENHRTRLWLPESVSVYIAYNGRRYERLHNFTQFQLFSVDADQSIKEPAESKTKFSEWAQSLAK